jgi:hypothetical protein
MSTNLEIFNCENSRNSIGWQSTGAGVDISISSGLDSSVSIELKFLMAEDRLKA